MTTFKIIYQSIARRFSAPDTITWSDLESKLRELFSLQPSFKFSLSYTDDEGDIITLSTDLELQEFLSSQSIQSTLKFVLTPDKKLVDTFSSNTSENDFVSIEKENDDKQATVTETADDKQATVTEAADEPSFNPTIPSISKGKQKEESSAESSTFATNEQQQEEKPSSNNNEQRAPFIELAEQFQGLLDQFKDVLSKNPQLVEQANNIMDQILRNVPVDIDQWAQWLNNLRSEGDTKPTNVQGESNNSQGEQQQQSGFRQFPSFFPPPHALLSSPWIQRIVQDVCANYPEGLGNLENFARHNGQWNFNNGDQQRQEELSQEVLKEKINLLHSMGFWEDDVKNEELLKRYNGNVERVVEILIRQ